MMRIRFGFLSIFFHFAGLAIFLTFPSAQPPRPPKLVEFELQEKAQGSIPPIPPSPRNSKGLAPHPSLPVPHNLFPSSLGLLAERRGTHSESELGGVTSKHVFQNEEDFKISSADVFGDNSTAYFYRALFERIDSHLILPSLFAQYDHLGKVMVLFEVDPHGRLLGNSLQVASQDAILKVYILRALRQALLQPLPEAQTLKSLNAMSFKAQFAFLRESSRRNHEKQKIFTQPILNFARFTTEKAVATDLADQLKPETLNPNDLLNPFRIVESWENYEKRQKYREQGFDPFAEYRNDPDYNL